MSKHTPGPWNILWEQRGAIVTARNDCYDVAIVRDIGNEDNKANARLIAAAPKMYEYIASSASNGCAEAKRLIGEVGEA